MHETDAPGPVEHPDDGEGDELLDGFEADLDNVAAALDALDAGDLDAAEAVVAGLGDSPEATAPPADET